MAPWVSDHVAQRILTVLQYSSPGVLLLTFLVCFTWRSIRQTHDDFDDPISSSSAKIRGSAAVGGAPKATTLTGPGGKPLPSRPPSRQKASAAPLDFSRPRKLLFQWLALGLCLSFVAHAANVILHALVERHDGWWCGKACVVYVVGCFFVYCLVVLSLLDTKPSPSSAHVITWGLGFVIECFLLGAALAVYTNAHQERRIGDGNHGKIRSGMSQWEVAEVIIELVRIFILLFLVSFYLLFLQSRLKSHRKARQAAAAASSPTETTGLLSESRAENGTAIGTAREYGASTPTVPANHHAEGPAPPGWERPTTTPSRSWWEYIKGYSLFFPYLWPSKDRKLQVIVIICFVIVILQRGVQLLVPMQTAVITDLLSGDHGPVRMPWGPISMYILLRLLQGSNGLLGAARSVLWIPISQYSYRELSVAAFEHVHSLSLDFHLGKKTGEVLSALGKGSSINTFLEQVSFQVVPMIIDLCVAVGYFLYVFDVYYALIVAVVTFWYIYITIRMAQWRADIRRQMTNADREVDAVKNDSMVSYETVKYFNAEVYEFDRYRDAVAKFQRNEYRVLFSLNLMNVAQNMVFMTGLLLACFVVAYQISAGERSVGKFVALITYMVQLQAPLNFFGTFYRMIQSAMINSERMLELFKESPTVVDSPTATTLPSCEGGISFNHVQFAYDARKPALHSLDFQCAPGTTTALVGESGGGKSTVFRLLFRFYNAQSGSIQVDGHDVQDITIDSLRQQIGVVPQDTVLFNESIMYNLKYANQSASDEDVYAACRAASIHDKILTFPDGYNTKVGERGLRLSGGEKQRVAIARTIIKDPRIILLDEATAALDTETEQHIQEALTTLGQGRTMLVIAHRLSTITTADQILVLHEGRVAERGTHDQLLAAKGRYASMWRKQVRAQRAAEQARELKATAERLRKEIVGEDGGDVSSSGSHVGIGGTDGSASPSEDERERERKSERERQRKRQRGGNLVVPSDDRIQHQHDEHDHEHEEYRDGAVAPVSAATSTVLKPPGHP